MASRALLVLGVLLSVLILISAQVSARELAEEKSREKENSTGMQDQPEYYGGGGYNQGGGGYNRGGGGYNQGGGGYKRGGGGYNRCYHGCCGRGYYGGCHCCSSADEIPEAAYLPDHN